MKATKIQLNNLKRGRLTRQINAAKEGSITWHRLRIKYLKLLPKRTFHDDAIRKHESAIMEIKNGK